jgi:anti-anti-sigma factor
MDSIPRVPAGATPGRGFHWAGLGFAAEESFSLDHWNWYAMPSAPGALVFALDHMRPGARLVRVLGQLDDRAGADLLNLINKQLSPTMDLLILDLTELTGFAPEAVRIVVQIAMELGRVDIGLCLVASDGAVETALENAGVRYLFELHGSVDEAIDIR